MKYLKKFIGLITIGFLSLNLTLNAQTIVIDSTFTSDTEIFPFTSGQIIHGLKVSGDIELYSDTSLVRIVLYDTNYNEYLLYEAYPMITNSTFFHFSEESDETCYLDSLSTYSIEIQLVNASLDLDSLIINLNPVSGASSMQKAYKTNLELQKVNSINEFNEDHNLI